MTVANFLRGSPARSNPARRPAWVLQHRHAEGGQWSDAAAAGGAGALADEVRAGWLGWRVGAAPGDLARVLRPDRKGSAGQAIKAGLAYAGAFGLAQLYDYGLAADGQLVVLPGALDHWDHTTDCIAWVRGDDEGEASWVAAWAESEDAADMLWATQGVVGRRALVRATAAALRGAWYDLPEVEDQADVARALARAEAWGRGTEAWDEDAAAADLARLDAARRRLDVARGPLAAAARTPGGGWVAAVDAAKELLGVSAGAWRASTAAERAAGLPVSPEARRRMADAVRTAIPLAEVVLGLIDLQRGHGVEGEGAGRA